MLEKKYQKIIISIILGLGIASLFRSACETRNCITIEGPKIDTVENSIYKFGNNCYKFKSINTPCN
jgi:hypothetical protein